jgi:hypothetical protein
MKPRIKSAIIIASSNGKKVRRRVMTIPRLNPIVEQRHNHNLSMT